MASKIPYDDVVDYLSLNERHGGLSPRQFRPTWTLFMTLLNRLQEAANDTAMENLALELTDAQRTWLLDLAHAANRIDDAEIAAAITEDDYHAQKSPRFGVHNPERMDVDFWTFMVRRSWNAWSARMQFDRACQEYMEQLGRRTLPPPDEFDALSDAEQDELLAQQPTYDKGGPVWSFSRFGMSHTRLPDGREIWIAGEHEDWYDPDFYIYNDVIVIHPDLSLDIYGYPRSVFRPTDHHSASLVGDHIYIIGCLGYHGTRQPGVTPVYRLDCRSFQIEPVETHGDNPGWIFQHKAEYHASENAIKVTGGKIFLRWEGKRQTKQNRKVHWLNLATGRWSSGRKPNAD